MLLNEKIKFISCKVEIERKDEELATKAQGGNGTRIGEQRHRLHTSGRRLMVEKWTSLDSTSSSLEESVFCGRT